MKISALSIACLAVSLGLALADFDYGGYGGYGGGDGKFAYMPVFPGYGGGRGGGGFGGVGIFIFICTLFFILKFGHNPLPNRTSSSPPISILQG